MFARASERGSDINGLHAISATGSVLQFCHGNNTNWRRETGSPAAAQLADHVGSNTWHELIQASKEARGAQASEVKSQSQFSPQTKSSRLQVGDAELLKWRNPSSKFQLPFDKMPWTIVRLSGTKVTVRQCLEEVSRNISHVMKFYDPGSSSEEGHGEGSSDGPSEAPSPIRPPDVAGPSEYHEPSQRLLAPGEETAAPEAIQQPMSVGRSEKTRYYLRSNPTPSSLLRHHVKYD
ncbi:hypothetical protein NDU88_000909 [Pleurodeles waltl]|uniref:Uncharacterized protein n=1 Tax=Pleurodeles waltl TaxID=8319 RepID=A0AAV7TIM3_PLEWA|nr:hypothetical protein NDU88_000909 [Pleurodeles waltl]